jgi:hypothetical protein
MITTSDVLEVMAVVAACHQRTAPRLDDQAVALATASVWVELLNDYDFTKAELVAAVKNRAKVCPDAPEVADVIRVARSARSEQMAQATPLHVEAHEDYPGDAKAADDMPGMPRDWPADKCVTVYWFALKMRAAPHTTAGWEALAAQLQRHRDEQAAS